MSEGVILCSLKTLTIKRINATKMWPSARSSRAINVVFLGEKEGLFGKDKQENFVK